MMEVNSEEDVHFICEQLANEASVKLCDFLDKIIFDLINEIVKSNFQKEKSERLLLKVLLLRIRNSNGDVKCASQTCKNVITNICNFILSFSCNKTQNHIQFCELLKLSLDSLITAEEDEFCLNFTKTIVEEFSQGCNHQLQHGKHQMIMLAVECLLDVLIAQMSNNELSNVSNTKCFLQSDRLHTIISNFMIKCDNQTLLTNMVFVIIPKLLEVSKVNTIINLLWANINSEEKVDNISLSRKLFILCGLAEFFISNSKGTFSVIKLHRFWELIQESLVSNDAVLRKKGLYLLKRSIDSAVAQNLTLNMELFPWNPLISDSLRLFWEKMFIVFEVLEEKQAHLVTPVVQSALKLPEEFVQAPVHPSWFLVVYRRILSHDSFQVVKFGILHFLKICVNVYCNWAYEKMIEVLFHKLNNMLLFSSVTNKHNVEWSEVDLALKKWFTAILLESKMPTEFFSVIVRAMTKIQWCTIPLFHVLHNMSLIPSAELFDETQLSMFNDFLKETIRTQNVFVRSAVQCAILNLLTKHVRKDVSMSHVAVTLSVFRQSECLHRGLITWETAKQWIQSCTSLKEENIVTQLLVMENSLSLESKARCLVLFVDSGLIDMNSNYQDVITNSLNIGGKTFEFEDCTIFSEESLEFILHIVEESKYLSSELELKNDCLIKSISPCINMVIPFIAKKVLNDTENDTLNFESIQLYIKTLQILADNDLITLIEGRELMKCSERYLSQDQGTLQHYFLLKIHLWYIQFVIKERNFDGNIKSKCLSIFHNGYLFLNSTKERDLPGNEKLNWSKLISAYLHTLWSIIQHSLNAEFVVLLDILTIVPAEELIRLATSSIETGGRDSFVPILGVVQSVLPYVVSNTGLCERFLVFTWKSCFELRKVALFWPSIKAWIEMTFNNLLIQEKELQDTIVNFAKEILTQGEVVGGLSNVLLHHLKQELTDVKSVKPLLGTLTSALLFGPVLRKDQRIENETCELIASLGSSYAVNDLIPRKALDSSGEVRALALSILLGTAGQNGVEMLVEMVHLLLDRDAELTRQRQRYHGDSMHHRLKHRILQALLVLEDTLANSDLPLAKSCVEELVLWSSASLQADSQQPSVRYQLEWLLIRSLLHSPPHLSNFWSIFGQASEERTGSICSFISVAYHLAMTLRERSFIDRCITEILPWCMAQHFNVRLYAQVVLQKLWPLNSEVACKYEAIRNSLTKSLNQGNSIRNADKLKNDFYFTAFKPLDHFSLETIFWELPRLSNISKDEWIPVSTLIQCFSEIGLHLPLTNKNETLKEFCAATWVVKTTAETEVEVETSGMQKKFVPWKSMFPELELSSEPQLRTELIVVASLIDKLPNLGGLARSCEIFAAQCLVVPSLACTQDKLFSTLSMSAEKHINIVEVKPHDLPQYLREKKSCGYSLVGAEQTAASVSLETFTFPKKCLLLLGNEKEGIPVNLLPLLDVCVEVRQLGVVRSLNVHVTGALFVWEYTRQHVGQDATNMTGK